MTQEHIDLLTKDLSARLHYRLKIKTDYITTATLISIRKNINYGANKDLVVTYDISGQETPFQGDERYGTISQIKPYLFPLSSMTEEHKEEYTHIVNYISSDDTDKWKEGEFIYVEQLEQLLHFYHKNHLDYRCLIEKGLALDATGKNIY